MSDTDRLLAALPILMAVHNLEEYLGMEGYARRRGLPAGRRQIQVALALATVLPAVTAGLALHSPAGSRRKLAALAMPGLLLANALSHTGQTLIFREPSPGLWSALGLLLPFSLRVAGASVREGYLTAHRRCQIMGLGAALMAPSALALQGIGWLAERLLPTRRFNSAPGSAPSSLQIGH